MGVNKSGAIKMANTSGEKRLYYMLYHGVVSDGSLHLVITPLGIKGVILY